MGGIGSGRRFHPNAKETTEDYWPIDIRRLKRENLLSPSLRYEWHWFRGDDKVASLKIRAEENQLWFSHCWGRGSGKWKAQIYPVEITSTRPNLGGERPWFLCPVDGCGKRVALLYGGSRFACRDCHNLTYPSQRQPDFDRAARRADRIRKKLVWPAGFLNGNGLKPKGMHWQTFERLVGVHDAFVDTSVGAFVERYGVSPGETQAFPTNSQAS